MQDELVTIEQAKDLKARGFDKTTEYYYQDIDLPYSPKGLKKLKNGKKLNHNVYDNFIYSAPTRRMGFNWLDKKGVFDH